MLNKRDELLETSGAAQGGKIRGCNTLKSHEKRKNSWEFVPLSQKIRDARAPPGTPGLADIGDDTFLFHSNNQQ